MSCEIKPCPLCQAEGKVVPDRTGFHVKCTRGSCMWVGTWSKTQAEAVHRWNTEWPRKEGDT